MSTAPSTVTPNSATTLVVSSKAGDVFSTSVADDGQPTDRSLSNHPADEEDEEAGGEEREGDEEEGEGGGEEREGGGEEGEDDDGDRRGRTQQASTKVKQSTARPLPPAQSNAGRNGGGRPSGAHLQGASNKTNRRKGDSKGGCVLM